MEKAGEAQGLKIFLVDDDPKILDLYTKVLRKGGYFTIAVSSAADALEIVDRGLTKVDLIIADINMPGLNGIEFHHRVKERRADLADKIIFITGGVFEDEMAESLAAIPNPILKKPLEFEILLKTVAQVSSRK